MKLKIFLASIILYVIMPLAQADVFITPYTSKAYSPSLQNYNYNSVNFYDNEPSITGSQGADISYVHSVNEKYTLRILHTRSYSLYNDYKGNTFMLSYTFKF